MSSNVRIVLILVLLVGGAGLVAYLTTTSDPVMPDQPGERPDEVVREAPPVPIGKPGGLTGEVRVYKTNEPAPGLAVRIEGAGDVIEAKTGDDGRFSAMVPSGPTVTVTVTAPEPYADIVLKGIVVKPDKTTSLGALYLERAFLVKGIVVTQLGDPVPGATVGAYRATFGDGPGRNFLDFFKEIERKRVPLEEARSAEDGTFKLASLSPGTYRLEASADGFAVGVKSKAIASPESENVVHRIVMKPGTALTGLVKTPQDVPVEDAMVTVVRFNQRAFTDFDFHPVQAKTDEEGRFHFTNLTPGQAMISVAAEGFPTKMENNVQVGQQAEVTITIGGNAALAGRITNAAGEPIAGASITSAVGRRGGSFIQTETDENGNYRVENVSVGTVSFFRVTAAGYASFPPADQMMGMQRGMGKTEDGKTLTKDITLQTGARLIGRVTSQTDGTPVVGARVDAMSMAGMMFGADNTDFTDEDGNYALEGLGKGGYLLMVKAPGYYVGGMGPQLMQQLYGFGGGGSEPAEDSPAFKIKEGDTEKRKDLALLKGATASGVVVDPNGQPVSGARVTIAPAQGAGGMAFFSAFLSPTSDPVLTDAEGRFKLTGLAASDKMRVKAEAQDWVEGLSDEFAVVSGEETAELKISLQTGGKITGVVNGADGVPLARAEVRTMPETDNPQNRWSQRWQLQNADPVLTDAAGNFSIERMKPGRHMLQIRASGHQTIDRTGVNVPEGGDGGPISVELPKGLEIAGICVDEQGKPVTGATMWITANARPGEVVSIPTRNMTTEEDGSFRFEGLSPGAYSINFNTQDEYARKEVKDVAAGTTDLRVTLEKGLSIKGRVVLPNGTPADNIWVTARGENNRNENDRTDIDGKFELKNLPTGTYTVTANSPTGAGFRGGGANEDAPDLRSSHQEGVPAGAENIEIRLRPGASITGTVTDAAGNPLSGANVWASAAQPAGSGYDGGWARTDEEGRFRVRGLDPAKTYNLSGSHSDYMGGKSVEATGGATGVTLVFGEKRERRPSSNNGIAPEVEMVRPR